MATESEKACARVVIHGRVQGVFFRAETMSHARRHGLTGWVRNCYDGSVEAQFEGDRADIQSMIEWCYQGPPAADVNDVVVHWCQPEGFEEFKIAY